MFIHANIKFLRNYTKLSQAQFGDLFGKSRSNIDSYERGTPPSEDLLGKISKHFNISVDTLLYKDLQSNPGLMLGGNGNNIDDILKTKDELIKELKKQIQFLQTQNETLLKKIPQ